MTVKVKEIWYNEYDRVSLNTYLEGHWNNVGYSQLAKRFRKFTVNADYGDKTDKTRIWGYDYMTRERINETQQGLTILQLNTDKGDIIYEY